MKKLISTICIICILLSFNTAHAQNYAQDIGEPIYVIVENVGDKLEIFGWLSRYPAGTFVTLWVGDVDKPIYIKEQFVGSDGGFCFSFEPADDVEPGDYVFRMCSNTGIDVYTSYLHYDGKTKEDIEYFADGNFNVSIYSNNPTITGSVWTIPDVTAEFALTDRQTGHVYISQTINSDCNNYNHFSLDLPAVHNSFDYKATLKCYNKNEILLDVSTDIYLRNQSISQVVFEGNINMQDNVEALMLAQIGNLQEAPYIFDKSLSFSQAVPNVLYMFNGSFSMSAAKHYNYQSDNKVIMFENEQLYNKLREIDSNLDPDLDRIIEGYELSNIKGNLDLSGTDISSITGLEHCTGITSLDISSNNISDISRLHKLDNLQILYADSNKIEKITKLPKNLKYADLGNNCITVVSNYNDYSNLIFFFAKNNDIASISGLANNTNLRYVNMENNNISDISPLAKCKNLVHLDLNQNNIEDVSPLNDLISLTYLDLGDNEIYDISQLPDVRYHTFDVSQNYLSADDVSQVSAINKLYLTEKQN